MYQLHVLAIILAIIRFVLNSSNHAIIAVYIWGTRSHLQQLYHQTIVNEILSPSIHCKYCIYYRIFRPITRALSIQKGSEIVKKEHVRYTLERFPTDNARVICTKKVSENTVLCIKHNFQLKLVCSIHSIALLNITLFKSKKFFIGLYTERINHS